MKKKKHGQIYSSHRYFFVVVIFLFGVIGVMILPSLINSLRTDVGYDKIFQDCSNIPSDREPIVATGVIDYDASLYTTTVITEENASHLEQINTFYLNRDRFETNPYGYSNHPPITHPAVDYVIYPHFFTGYPTRVAICGEDDTPLRVILKGESADDILFSPDGDLFLIADSHRRNPPTPNISFYDAVTLEEVYTLWTGKMITDIAFHPNLPLIATVDRTREYDTNSEHYEYHYFLSIWNYPIDNEFSRVSEEISRVELEASHTNIYFNQEGTAIINYSDEANTPVYVWGVPSD